MLIVSVPGRLVRDPATHRVVDEHPLDVDPSDPLWARFIADGDVAEVRVDQPVDEAAAAPLADDLGDAAPDVQRGASLGAADPPAVVDEVFEHPDDRTDAELSAGDAIEAVAADQPTTGDGAPAGKDLEA